jgi:hypothetical protein
MTASGYFFVAVGDGNGTLKTSFISYRRNRMNVYVKPRLT